MDVINGLQGKVPEFKSSRGKKKDDKIFKENLDEYKKWLQLKANGTIN